MRFVLAIIAALANAAGPWLCCCAMAATVPTPKAPEKKPAPKCSHCVQEAPPAGDREAPAPAKHCPCQEHRVADPAVQPAPETAAVADQMAHDFDALVGVVAVEPTPAPAPSQLSGVPFLTAETRLHVHHVLLC